MSKLTIAIGAAVAAGFLGLAAPAKAQYYYPGPQQGYYYQQPQPYVSPRILRKQQQLRQRVIEKYGFDPYRQQPGYYGRQNPNYYQPQPQYYPPQPRYRQVQPGYYGTPGGESIYRIRPGDRVVPPPGYATQAPQ